MATKLTNVDKEPKVVLVTSSLPQEGKTTFAVSLAAFVARSDKKVLVVDLDLRHPSVHRELDWQVSSGLVEYMGGELDRLRGNGGATQEALSLILASPPAWPTRFCLCSNGVRQSLRPPKTACKLCVMSAHRLPAWSSVRSI